MNTDHITDDWIDDGQYSAQTVINLRDCVRELQPLAEAMAQAIEHERDHYPTLWKHSRLLQNSLVEYRKSFPASPAGDVEGQKGGVA